MLPKCALTVSSRNKSNYTNSVPLVCALSLHLPHVDFSDVNWPGLNIFLEVELHCYRVTSVPLIHPLIGKGLHFFHSHLMSEMNSISYFSL